RRQVALFHRKLARHLRSGGAWPTGDAEQGWPESREGSPPELVASAEQAMLVRLTLNELPAGYGALLTSRYLEGATVEQIANAERTTVTAVRSQLARARRAFRLAFHRYSGPFSEYRTKRVP